MYKCPSLFIIYIYIFIYTHTYTHKYIYVYIYIYNKGVPRAAGAGPELQRLQRP